VWRLTRELLTNTRSLEKLWAISTASSVMSFAYEQTAVT
jgi:hypothetical protein